MATRRSVLFEFVVFGGIFDQAELVNILGGAAARTGTDKILCWRVFEADPAGGLIADFLNVDDGWHGFSIDQ